MDRGSHADFPLWDRNPELVYLDYASTAPKFRSALEAGQRYDRDFSANVHRASYGIAAEAEEAYEGARRAVGQVFNVSEDHVSFTKGTTEAINLVASCWLSQAQPGDKVLVTQAEHHANYVSWFLAAERNGVEVLVAPIRPDGTLDQEAYLALLDQGPTIAAFTRTSNVTGVSFPVAWMAAEAKRRGVATLVDAAQAAPHERIDFHEWVVDFLVCSAHKMYGPTGVGALIASPTRFNELPTYHGGGGMIESVSSDGIRYVSGARKFEAGTPPIAAAIGFGAACQELAARLTASALADRTNQMERLLTGLASLGAVTAGNPPADGHLVSFTVPGAHPFDLATWLDQRQICVRDGQHCAHPLHQALGLTATLRVSLGLPTSDEEVERFLESLAWAIGKVRR
jgi:cysteine desulfurase / selenocysteine lyase